jgi:hypothetical protein
MDTPEGDRTKADAASTPEPKKPYVAPKLIKHGSVEQITQALGSGTKDGLSGSAIL